MRWLIRMVSLLTLLLNGCSAPGAGFIGYERTGGFMRLDDKLVIQKDGKATLTQHGQSTSFQLDTAELNKLVALFEASHVDTLQRNYPASGNDLIQYRVTYKGQTVQAQDGSIPVELQPVIDALNTLVDTTH